jgi:hypothetical protein
MSRSPIDTALKVLTVIAGLLILLALVNVDWSTEPCSEGFVMVRGSNGHNVCVQGYRPHGG